MGSIDVRKFKWKHNAAVHRSFAVEFIKICRYKTFWMRIVAPRTLLYTIHVEMCVLVRYSARKLTLNAGLRTAMFSGMFSEKKPETGRI